MFSPAALNIRRNTVNIVYAVTNDYHDKLLPSMRSLLDHNPKAKVFIVTESDKVDGLPGKATVINIRDQQYFKPEDVNYNNPFTYINLLKVCYPEILSVNKVIHLDVDAIVADDLTPLWKTDVKGKWFAAVPEWHGNYNPFGGHYFNMGVALINLEQMRKDNAVPELVSYLNAYKQPYADQDAWNALALKYDKAVIAGTRFNECIPCGTTAAPAVVHFCGFKGWWDQKYLPRVGYLDKYRA